MLTGRYNYNVTKKLGNKIGYMDITVNGNKIQGVVFIKKKEVPVDGKIDGHKVEIYGSSVGKFRPYIFNFIGNYADNALKGKFEDKHGAKDFIAVYTGEIPAKPVVAEEQNSQQ